MKGTESNEKALKTFLCVLCASALFTGITGCGSNDGGSGTTASESRENISVREILEKIKDSDDTKLDASLYFDDSAFQENCSKLYSIEYSQLSDGGILFCESGEYADEISILKPADGDAESAAEILEKRKEARMQVYEGYSPPKRRKLRTLLFLQKTVVRRW